MNFGTRAAGGFETQADLDAFERLYPNDGGGDAAIEPAVPGHAAPQSNRAAEDVSLDDPTGGVLGELLSVDERLHAGIRFGVE